MWKYAKCFLLTVVVILLAFCFTGCSMGEKEAEKDNSLPDEYYDIKSRKQEVFKAFGRSGMGMFLGMQYYNGEIIQLRTVGTEVYLRHEDGSKELLEDDMPEASQLLWFLDREGNRYCWEQDFMLSSVMGESRKENYSILKMDSTGKEIYRTQLGQGIKPLDICQLEDRRVILLLVNQENNMREVAELNPDTGLVTTIKEIQLVSKGICCIAGGTQGLLLLEEGYAAGISEINLEDGKILANQSFTSGSYSMGTDTPGMQVQDFLIGEDGSVKILWADTETAKGVCETLRLEKIEKTPIVIATPYIIDSWMLGKITEFNQSNENYYVIPQCGNNVNYGEFATRLQLEVTTGKGPDILYEDGLWGLGALVEKGGFEDLAPYMKASGMKEEDYFPAAFSYWRQGEKINAVSLHISSGYSYIRADVMGGEEPESIEAYLDAMLNWENMEILNDSWGLSANLLTSCLMHSDDMQGMIDWKQGTCDFSGELFIKMMDYAKRYGIHTLDEAIKYHGTVVVEEYTTSVYCYDDFSAFVSVEEMRQQGWVRYSPLFDDGIYPVTAGTYPDGIMAINANSSHKQGAWEFICFMMSEQVQKTNPNNSPNRNAFMIHLNNDIKDMLKAEALRQIIDAGNLDSLESLDSLDEGITEASIAEYINRNEERVNEYLNMFEEGRDLSAQYLKMQPIIDIIEDESVYYFTDVKSAEEVIAIINNRVQLYLDER